MTFGGAGYDVSSGNQIVEQMQRRLSDLRLIEELDRQGQIDIEPKNIIRANSRHLPRTRQCL